MTLPIHLPSAQAKANALELSEQLRSGKMTVTLTPALAEMVGELLSRIGQGEAVTVVSVNQNLTTQEAADLLGVSRPYFVKQVLQAGKLPFQMVGSHRRIRLADLLRYQEQDLTERYAALDELSAEAERLGLPW